MWVMMASGYWAAIWERTKGAIFSGQVTTKKIVWLREAISRVMVSSLPKRRSQREVLRVFLSEERIFGGADLKDGAGSGFGHSSSINDFGCIICSRQTEN